MSPTHSNHKKAASSFNKGLCSLGNKSLIQAMQVELQTKGNNKHR